MNRWLMPQELPAVACSLLKESGEIPLLELARAAKEVSSKALGSRWSSREDCPCTMPAGANLQAAYPELRHIQLDTPEGLIAGLGYALTRPGHTFQFHQANTAEECSGLAGVRQWSIMLPTSARVAQEVYEPLIGIHYPMLCTVKNSNWHIGTGSIRTEDQLATGFRFVNWVHDVPDPEIRAVPTPEATNTVYRQIEQWLPMADRENDSVLALTTRTLSAQHLQGFFQQSGRRANAETAVKVAGATAKHCIVLHGKSTFLSGASPSNDVDHECYTRANVAYSRATDPTVSACPVNMHGTTGVTQVLSALLHGACALYTNDQKTSSAQVWGNFSVNRQWVSESTAAFRAAVEPQPLWTGSLPVCLVEYHQGHSRRLRLMLTTQTHLTKGEKSLLNEQHPVHGKIHWSGLLFGYAADRCAEPDWYVLPDGRQPTAWKLLHAARKGGDRFCVGSGHRYAFGQADDTANKAREYQFESLHKIYFYDAWRWKIELNQPESPLRLPPRPGLLQNGCYWQQLHAHPADAAHTHNTQDSAALAEISLSETSSDASAEPAPPTEVPEPVSPETNESPTSPITIGSAEEEHDGPQPNATEPSEEATPAATIASTSEVDKAQERRTGTVASPDTSAAAFVVEQREQSEGERAEETESGTTDEVIDLDDSPEAIPAHPARSPSEGVMVKRAMVVTRVAALLHLLRIPAPSTSLQRRRRGEIDGDQACQLSQEPLLTE